MKKSLFVILALSLGLSTTAFAATPVQLTPEQVKATGERVLQGYKALTNRDWYSGVDEKQSVCNRDTESKLTCTFIFLSRNALGNPPIPVARVTVVGGGYGNDIFEWVTSFFIEPII